MALPDVRYRLYGFMVRCLTFLVPRPIIRREIVAEFLSFWLGQAAAVSSSARPQRPGQGLAVYRSLFSAATENRQSVQSTIEDIVAELLSQGPDCMSACAAAELALVTKGGSLFPMYFGVSRLDQSGGIFATPFIERHASAFIALASVDIRVAVFLVEQLPNWSESEVLEHHGFAALVSMCWSRFARAGRLVFPGNILWTLEQSHTPPLGYWDRYSGLAERLLGLPTPWIANCRAFEPDKMAFGAHSGAGDAAPPQDIPSAVLFLAFAVGALVVECSLSDIDARNPLSKDASLVKELETSVASNKKLGKLMSIWQYRIDRQDVTGDPVDWQYFRFSPAQEGLIRAWMERKIHLVGTRAPVDDGLLSGQADDEGASA